MPDLLTQFDPGKCGRFVLLMVAIGLVVCADGGTIRDDRSDADYLSLAAQSQFEPIGKLNLISTGSLICSGTLIAPRYVVYPAHCINQLTDPTTLGFEVGGVTYPVAEIILHPDWPAGNPNPPPTIDGNDIAIIRLATPVTGVTPAQRYRGTTDLGVTGTFVGFGWTGDGVTGQIPGTGGTKRAGENMLDALGSTLSISDRIILSDFDEPSSPTTSVIGAPLPLNLEYQLAAKDSGAGVFIFEGGQWFLAGIGVFVADFNNNGLGDEIISNYGDLSGATRIAPHVSWIDSVLCPADFNSDQSVNVTDLLDLLAAWGPCPAPCPEDINDDGAVNVTDLLSLLAGWGVCP